MNRERQVRGTPPVAYLEFQKGASLVTSAHTKEGANQVFLFFPMVKKCVKGAMAQPP